MEILTAITDANTLASSIWKNDIRYIGVGTMLVGGIWTIITLLKPIKTGIKSSFASVRIIRHQGYQTLPRIERDMPIHYVILALIILLIPLGSLLYHFINTVNLPATTNLKIVLVCGSTLFVLLAGFMFASLCGYFAGLVGSSNNPISGMAMSALLIAALLLFGAFALANTSISTDAAKLAAAALVVFITTAILTAAAITNDTIQDLKAGQIVGATPWKQQVMLIIGTLIAAVVIPPILELLFNAYGIGSIFPRPGMDPSQALSAPQAMLMSTLTIGVFSHNLPWPMLISGAAIALVSIVIDTLLKKKGANLPVLAVGLGIYLPIGVTMPLVLGGIASFFIERSLNKNYSKPHQIKYAEKSRQQGLVAACGIVAGASLMGVVLAIPFSIAKSTTILRLVPSSFTPYANLLGTIASIIVLVWLYFVTLPSPKIT